LAEGSRETLAGDEVAAVAAPGTRASVADGAVSPLTPLTAESVRSVQRSAGNRAAAAYVARQRVLQRSGGLLKPQKVQDVYGYWLLELGKARGVNVGDVSIDAAARARTKAQVGDLNFAQWERWERGIDEQAAAAGERAAAPAFDPEANLRARHDAMWKATASLRAEVVQTEYLCQKLNFGKGAKATAARLTAGGYTAMWGIGARTVGSVAEHVPMLVVSTVGFVFGSELAERTLIKQGRAIAKEGGEMGEDVYTAQLLVGGDMQAAYDATRGPYANYQAAFTAFSDASSQFLKDQARDGVDGYLARAKDIAAMEAAEKQMRETSAEYQMACAKLGVQSSAKRLDTLGAHIVQGQQEAVATAVTFGLPEVAPGLGELKQAVKGAEGMSAKQIEKEAAEAVAESMVKQEGKALTVGLEAEAKTGMPVRNQQAIADACKAHDVVIDVRPTNPEAPRRLVEGNLPKPEAIKAKSINQIDTYLGFRKEDVGLVGYMEPKPPVRSEVPPELWEQVEKRYAERAAEFKDLAPEMKNLSRPVGARDQFAAVGFDKQVTVDASGVIRVVEGSEGKASVGFTGDHDIFQITNLDGTPVSGQKYNDVVADLAQQRVGVEHGAHMHWDVPAKPASPAYKDPTKGFQGIAGKHMPGAKGGEDLYRFAPDGSITPVRATPGKDTLEAARAAGRADKAAAVPDIDKTIQGIGPP
jgi:hypothetical protein